MEEEGEGERRCKRTEERISSIQSVKRPALDWKMTNGMDQMSRNNWIAPIPRRLSQALQVVLEAIGRP
jgi:hypothetical protein